MLYFRYNRIQVSLRVEKYSFATAIQWMVRLRQSMKGVASCEKPWVDACSL
ncbi:hypothetical protein HUU53_03670 [Candidatus Micrarchaeota archaeon]|nr:hypothetical protein [Candidatus Micrarchaeota archaeon]